MQAKGLLTVVGSLDFSQFWPASKGTRSSDGDTVHLKVDPATSFLFSRSAGSKPKKTSKFTGAYVIDHGKKNLVITSKSEMKIRLQGIDAPELHFPVIGKVNPAKKGKYKGEFRQPYGASATQALYDDLKAMAASGTTVLHATFVTRIDKPAQAVDSHGRFVGDIIVGTAAGKSINTWMVENGWAYPLFYDSMTKGEVNTLLAAWKKGKNMKSRPGKALAKPLQPFDPARTVDNAKLPDGGSLNYPKIFRRQATFWTQVPGPLSGEDFKKLMDKGMKGKGDKAYPLQYFLANIDKLDTKKRIALASKIGKQGQTNFNPEELVFQEDPSTLLDASGATVTGF